MISSLDAKKTARFIPFSRHEPFKNMAIDEWMISWNEKTAIPVFRLYSWSPPGISMGRNQDAQRDIDIEKCHRDNIRIVRRLTGGGAIFHDSEVTYSLACSARDISEEELGIKASFEKLNHFIIRMYSKLGLDASFAKDILPDGKKLGAREGFCFAGNEEFDIIIKSLKIGGNAQFRRKSHIFQHGSIPLSVNKGEKEYFKCRINNGNYTSLDQLLGREASALEVSTRLANSFREITGLNLEEEPLSEIEKKEVSELIATKYATDKWNLRTP